VAHAPAGSERASATVRTAHAIAKVPIQATVGLVNGRPLTERGPDLTPTLMRAATVLTARSVFRRG